MPYECSILFHFLVMFNLNVFIVNDSNHTGQALQSHLYMNVLDTLLLGFAAFTCRVLSRMYFEHQEIQVFINFCIPTFAFELILNLSSILIKSNKWLSSK